MSNKNPKLRKNGGNGTNSGNFIRGILGAAPKVIDLITGGKFTEAISLISSSPDNAGLSNEQADELFRLIELEIKDKERASEMYIKADNTTANFIAKRIINYNLWVALIVIFIEILAVVYIEDKVLIAIISTAVGGLSTALLQERQQVISFFFGSSLGSKAKTESMIKK